MKGAIPLDDQIDVISSDDSYGDSGTEINNGSDINMSTTDIIIDQPARDFMTEETLLRRAKMYQDYMKQIPIPTRRGSVIPFTSWIGLGRSMKQLYSQPLHYLTNILLKQWDQLRIGSEDEHKPLDSVVHPCKAEATVWLMEEVHRKTSGHTHIAKLWMVDSMHHAFVDSIFPTLENQSG